MNRNIASLTMSAGQALVGRTNPVHSEECAISLLVDALP